jgi:hypothetical protein
MKLILKTIWVFLILGIISNPVYSLTGPIKPVTPNASPEVVALLKFFQDNSGKYTLTGQHN